MPLCASSSTRSTRSEIAFHTRQAISAAEASLRPTPESVVIKRRKSLCLCVFVRASSTAGGRDVWSFLGAARYVVQRYIEHCR